MEVAYSRTASKHKKKSVSKKKAMDYAQTKESLSRDKVRVHNPVSWHICARSIYL